MADMTLEEALAAATVDEELVTPVNEVLMINPETRTINVPDSEKLFGARQDMGVERKYFKCPRIVGDNIDLSEHRIFVNYVPSKQDGTYNLEDDVQGYWCKDLAVEGDFITFSWEISENVTRKAGYIAFAVYAKVSDENGNLKTKWHTTIAIGNVLDTLPDGEEWITVYPDIVMQLLERMDEVEKIATPESMQGYVDDYFNRNPMMIDRELKDETKAAPADIVGKLSEEIGDLSQLSAYGSNVAEILLKLISGGNITPDEEETLKSVLPYVYVNGDLTGISADDYVNVTCNYVDETNNVEFTDYAEIAWQGSSSINFTNVESGVDKAKNYKIKLYTDETRETKSKRVFKDWFATNNFHIKANYGDCTNFMNNMMMHFLTKSYQYLTPLPREGARYTVDGFPCLLYINDVFCGIRFWNLKQDDKVYNLNEETVNETSGEVTQEADLCYQIGLNNGSSKGDNSGAFIYGNLNEGSNANLNFADAHAEIDYYWEDRVWDKTSNHPSVLYDTIQWVSEASDEEFKANLENYFDKEYLIHYFVMIYACGMGDSICKNFNMLYFPDKGKWYATFWDMDFSFGTSWNLGTTPYDVDVLSSSYGASRLFTKLWSNFKDDIVTEYWKLRNTILTVGQVEESINAVWGGVSDEWISKNNTAKYSGTSYDGRFKVDGANYVLEWASKRFQYIDHLEDFVIESDVKTTSVVLDKTELNFTNTERQTITATVEPFDSPEPVVWSSSNENVATVMGGCVTPVGSGECTIYATSGSVTASCAVNVSENINVRDVDYDSGYINDSGEITELSNAYVSNLYDKAVNTLTITAPISVSTYRIAEYDEDKNFICRQYGTNWKFSLNSATRYVRIGFVVINGTDLEALFSGYTISTDYIDFVRTIVSGTLDSTYGEFVEDSTRCYTPMAIPVSNTTINVKTYIGTIAFRCYNMEGDYLGLANPPGVTNVETVKFADGTTSVKLVIPVSDVASISGKIILLGDYGVLLEAGQ